MTPEFFSAIQPFAIALVVGVSSGAVGAFIILRRMALVGDALSHVALPGIALALLYGIDPFWGVLVFLTGAAFIIWRIEHRTKLPTDAIVGILFTTSLALGILFIPDAEILEALFGEFPQFPPAVFLAVVAAAVISVFVTFLFTKQFLFAIASPELSLLRDRAGVSTLLLLLIFSFVVALGIKLVGTLLMGALTIIPASIAKNVTRSMKGYMVLSAALGGAIACAGVWLATAYGFLPGPTIILIGTAFFLLSLALRK